MPSGQINAVAGSTAAGSADWDCHGCTDCCREYRVQVTPEEKARIKAQGWQTDPALQSKKLFVWDGGWLTGRYRLNHSEGGCVFLNEAGGCRIHAKFGAEAKPLACRVYPFVLTPAGDRWRVGLRFACPSAANDQGRPVATHQSAIREYAEALESQERLADRRLSTPKLQRGQSMNWSDIDLVLQSLREIVQENRRPLEWRLRKMLALVEIGRQARFDVIGNVLE